MRAFGEERRRDTGVPRGLGYFLNNFCLLESEVAGTRVAVVVELLLDVDHVAAGVLQLSELRSATEVSEVAELGQP